MDPTKAAIATVPGIIFDLDGTLADTLEDITDAVNHALAGQVSQPYHPTQIRRWVGDGVKELLSRAAGIDDAGAVEPLIAGFRSYYGRHCLDKTRLYDGWDEVLRSLAERGVPMAVLSNKPDDFTRRIVEALAGSGVFAHVAGQREGVPRKPDPTQALALCRILNRPPSQVLFVGDSPHDIQTARAGGMRPVAVTWGFREEAELCASPDVALLRTPADLLALL